MLGLVQWYDREDHIRSVLFPLTHASQIEPLHGVRESWGVKGLPTVSIPMERKNMSKKRKPGALAGFLKCGLLGRLR